MTRRAQRMEWIEERKRGWQPKPLNLKLKDAQEPLAQPRRGYSTPAGLVSGRDYMLQQQIDKGYLKQVEYQSDFFVSQGFVQAKPGRFFPGTNIPMVRLLVDCRALNQACTDAPYHHVPCCPSQAGMCMGVPIGAKFFRNYDLSDAYHSCPVTPETAKLLVVQFDGKYYQYQGGAQGIANMALHWNVHIMDDFNRILGDAWHEWYTLYVDDIGVHGFTLQQACNRGEILEDVLTSLNKPFSDKTGAEYSDTLILAGMCFNEHGVRLDDDAIDSLKQCLKEYPVKNVRDIQHVVGVIQYTNSAFEWPDQTPSAEYSDLLAQLNAMTKLPPRQIRSTWSEKIPPMRDRLLSLITANERAYLDPLRGSRPPQ